MLRGQKPASNVMRPFPILLVMCVASLRSVWEWEGKSSFPRRGPGAPVVASTCRYARVGCLICDISPDQSHHHHGRMAPRQSGMQAWLLCHSMFLSEVGEGWQGRWRGAGEGLASPCRTVQCAPSVGTGRRPGAARAGRGGRPGEGDLRPLACATRRDVVACRALCCGRRSGPGS